MLRKVVDLARAVLLSAAARRVLLLVAVVLAGWLVVDQYAEIRRSLDRVGEGRLVLALLISLASVVIGAEGWRLVLFDAGRRDLLGAWSTYLLSNVGKYVPGAIWPVLIQRDYAAQRDRSFQEVSLAFVQILLFGVVGAAGVSLLVLPVVPLPAVARWGYLLVVVLVLLAVLADPNVGTSLVMRLGRRFGRSWECRRMPVGRGRGAITLLAAGWVLQGVAFHLLLVPLAVGGDVNPLWSVGGYALGALAGIAAAVLPGGLGSRELALAFVFGPVLDGGRLLSLLVISRVVTTAADLVGAAAGGAVRWVAARSDHAVPAVDREDVRPR